MQTIVQADAMRQWSREQRSQGRTVGFVPTMGALHAGHIELVRCAVKECDVAAVSVFVNPSQFGPGEDLDSYPRNLAQDSELLRQAGCRVLFHPAQAVLYPPGFETWVDQEKLPQHLCGLDRPTHFRGVTTVVSKLFHIVEPDRAYFGWKDAQQAVIIRKMAVELDFGLEVRIEPTVRDQDGLALSSRNAYLSEQEREKALRVPAAIQQARKYYESGGTSSAELLEQTKSLFKAVQGVSVDYIRLVRMDTLDDAEVVRPGTMLALAVRVGSTRLIDNCRFLEDRKCSES